MTASLGRALRVWAAFTLAEMYNTCAASSRWIAVGLQRSRALPSC